MTRFAKSRKSASLFRNERRPTHRHFEFDECPVRRSGHLGSGRVLGTAIPSAQRGGTLIRILWLRFQLFARLFFVVRLYGSRRLHTFGFVPIGVPACQQEIDDSQYHQRESIDKEPPISQHENATE